MADGQGSTWDGISLRSSLTGSGVTIRDRLADAARAGDWPVVFDILDQQPGWVNTVRLGGSSGFAPLHQAAWHGTSVAVVDRLVAAGSWRTLRTADGRRAVDIAGSKGHRSLIEPLTPVIHHRLPADLLAVLQRRLHELIRQRAGGLVDEHQLRLPELEPLTEQRVPAGRFPVPGMYGGFRYWLDGQELIVESLSRVAGGSGQRHVIRTEGTSLVEDGFG